MDTRRRGAHYTSTMARMRFARDYCSAGGIPLRGEKKIMLITITITIINNVQNHNTLDDAGAPQGPAECYT